MYNMEAIKKKKKKELLWKSSLRGEDYAGEVRVKWEATQSKSKIHDIFWMIIIRVRAANAG